MREDDWDPDDPWDDRKPEHGRGIGGGRGARPGDNNGGGPKTEEGLQRISEAAKVASTKHGLWRMVETGMVPGCDLCGMIDLCDRYRMGAPCAQAAEALEEVLSAVMAQEHVEEISRPLAREYAKIVVMVEVTDKHLQIHGPFKGTDDSLQPSGLMDLRMRLSSRMQDLAKELMLTPVAQQKAKRLSSQGNLGQMLLMLDELQQQDDQRRQQQDQMTMDGEFEPTGGDAR